MPTKPSRTITVKEAEIRRALDVVRRRWPGEADTVLLIRLVEAGVRAIEANGDGAASQRVEKIRGLARHGHFYNDDYLEDVRITMTTSKTSARAGTSNTVHRAASRT